MSADVLSERGLSSTPICCWKRVIFAGEFRDFLIRLKEAEPMLGELNSVTK